MFQKMASPPTRANRRHKDLDLQGNYVGAHQAVVVENVLAETPYAGFGEEPLL